jgi:DNA helicase-2/ATP-dependent DNA helicase PcrA
MTFGRSEFARPSRFFDDIPKDLLEDIDILGQTMQGANLSKFGRNTWQPPRMQTIDPKQQNTAANTASSGVNNGANSGVLRGGEKVTHPKFGKGTVVGVSGQGPRAEVTVVFDDSKVGAKKLALKYANLTPLT